MEVAADAGTVEPDRALLAVAGDLRIAEKYRSVGLQALGANGGAGLVGQLGAVAIKVAADAGTVKRDRALFAVAGDLRAAEERRPVDLQALGGDGRAGLVGQLRAGAIKVAADAGTV